jgi:threonyl-tRNA synthetase
MLSQDHREIGQNLDLFHFQEEAKGMVFWHPRGFAVLSLLRDALARIARADGFEEVQSPQILREPVWATSGHLAHFRQGMFAVRDEDEPAFVKPVSCPAHLEIFRRRQASYRELPLRYAEFGLVHRDEPSGTLHGLFRLRQFTQDDGHVFCAEEQVEAEVERFCRSLFDCYRGLGFEHVQVAFASRPGERAGADDNWDRAELMLSRAARAAGLEPEPAPGQGAFYGPKLEFALRDHAGRSWQCGTIQLDLILPERFDVSYVSSGGRKLRPAMLHRAVLGSLERFLGILLEQHGGKLPAWLSPEQVAVLPVGEKQEEAARSVVSELEGRGVRARVDARGESLSRRIRDAHERCVPFLITLGERELSRGTLSLRERRGERTLKRGEALDVVANACSSPF